MSLDGLLRIAGMMLVSLSTVRRERYRSHVVLKVRASSEVCPVSGATMCHPYDWGQEH